MKKVFLLLVMVFLFSGCASVYYKSPAGTEISYSRLFVSADSIKVELKDIGKMEVSSPKVDSTLKSGLDMIK